MIGVLKGFRCEGFGFRDSLRFFSWKCLGYEASGF